MAASPKRERVELEYPFSEQPEVGRLREVKPGVYWLRMPLPFELQHINLWLLDDGDSWVLVDTGLAYESSISVWEEVLKKVAQDKSIKRVICTHMHPDHVGLAGWLCRRGRAELLMSRGEYMQCRALLSDTNREAPEEAIRFYRSMGFDMEQIDRYQSKFGSFGKMLKGLPNAYRRLQHGDTLKIGDYQWRVMVGTGHSPEHVCLMCDELNLFISGDQLLPTISSNVSVWPLEPYANSLEEWLASCKQLRGELPADVLVLPSHGLPFVNARERLQELIEEHERDLLAVIDACAEPKRVVDLFSVLFRAVINKNNLMMAAGETQAHVNCLLERGLLKVEQDGDGVSWYRA